MVITSTLDGSNFGEVVALSIGIALAATALVCNRAVARYFVENNTTPFTFLHPQDRIPREDRPERLRDFRVARSFWLPFMRAWVVVLASAIGALCAANLVRAVF
jgi:hypothetical protein